MHLPLLIARRYLFSKKSHSAINFISLVSVCGVAVATMALVCALSVLNGFQDLISGLYNQIDPELKIYPAKGKVFNSQDEKLLELRNWEEIAIISETLEDNGLIKYADRQVIGTVKGVDNNFFHLTDMEEILYAGDFILSDSVANYATLGIGLASKLGIRVNYMDPVEVYMPNRTSKVNISNPSTAFNFDYLYVTGIFSIYQPKYDDHYIIVPLAVVREMLDYDNEVSAIEIKSSPKGDIEKTKKKLQKYLGENYIIKDRQEQQEDAYRVVQIEKWMTFLLLLFILLIATFNVIGSLSMLIIDKKEDVRTLKNLGADKKLIFRIFLFEGWMITLVGALIGIIAGIGLCLLQQHFGFLRLGDGTEAFIVNAYPVQLQFSDIVIVFLTVILLGLITAWFPAKNASEGEVVSQ
ncbi:MAG: FtsX-like permease family protein [Candidatus Azobacteroides sp.]|nr:FtsX-like permease family protein [Candidatus Azobacteroides sp.]